MSRSATSKADPVFTPRRSSRRSSLASPPRYSGRLSSLVQQFKDTNMDSFTSTPGRSILSDNTDIEQPRRQSWWKKLDDNNSRDIIEALGNQKEDYANNVLEELDVEILSQEKEQRNFSLDLPDSSGSETIDSIIIPDRKLFTQKENVPQKKFSNMFGPRESIAKLYKPNTEKIKDINTIVGPKKLFSQAPRDRHKIFEKVATSPIKMSQDDLIVAPKKLFNQDNPQRKTIFPDLINSSPKKSGDIIEPIAGPKNLFPQNKKERKSIFPSVLLETSVDKTANKTTEVRKEVQGQVRSLFGNRPTTKRKNMFADFIVVKSEDEVPEIQPGIFGLAKKPETKRRDSSPSHALTDAEDDWKMLPSSTMMKHMEGLSSPIKRPKLSTIPREHGSEGTHEVHVLTDDENGAEGSGWDSHRTTRKTLRQTFGKDFTPRKSLRALVMEKSAKRQTENPIRESVGHPQANSTAIVQNFTVPQEVVADASAHNTAVDNSGVDNAVNNIGDNAGDDNTGVDKNVNNTDDDNTGDNNTAGIECSVMENSDPKTPEIVRNFTVPQEMVEVTSAVNNTGVDKTAVYNTVADNTADMEYSAMETSVPKTPDIVQNLTVPLEVVMESSAVNTGFDKIADPKYSETETSNTEPPEIVQNFTLPQEDEVATSSVNNAVNNIAVAKTAEVEHSESETFDPKTPEIMQNLTIPQEKEVVKSADNTAVDNTADVEHSESETSEPKTPEREQNFTIPQEQEVVTSADNTAIDHTEVNNTSGDNISDDHAAVDNNSGDDTAADNISDDDTGIDNNSGDDTAADNISDDDTRIDNSGDDTAADNISGHNTSGDNIAVDDTVHNTSGDNTGVDITSAYNTAADDISGDDTARETTNPKTPDVSIRTRQTTLEIYLEKIRRDVMERKQKSEVAVKNLLAAPKRDMLSFYRASIKRLPRNNITTKPRVTKSKPSAIPLGRIPEEILQDMKYKPPKRFMKNDASWITKRLYKYLETKLEPKYDFKARVKAEKFVEHLYHFTKTIQKLEQAPLDSIKELKIIMARLDIVATHHEFYEFFYEFMPREVRIKVVPNITNKLPMPKHGIFNEIIRAER